jgi:hypothetical protein
MEKLNTDEDTVFIIIFSLDLKWLCCTFSSFLFLSLRVLNIQLANDSSVFLLFHYVTVRNFLFEITTTFLVKLFLISIIVEYCPCFPSVDLLASFSWKLHILHDSSRKAA